MSLTQIAELISAKSKELDQRGVVDPDSQLGFRNMTAKDYASRGILIQAIRDLEKLALGPLDALNILVSNVHTSSSTHQPHNRLTTPPQPLDVASTHAIARYNIAHHVPDAGTTIPALASALPFADEEYLARVLRHAIANGLFQEPQPGLITHTRLSRLLRDDPDALAMVQFVTEDLWPVPLRMCDALDRWPRSRDTAHTAWALATGVEGSPFEYFADRPATVARLAGMYRVDGRMLAQGMDGLEGSRVWREVDGPGAVVVDVGGAQGHVSARLAGVTRQVRFVVQDRPEVVAGARERVPVEFAGRIGFESHDFFEVQTREGAEVYFLRRILHSYPDHLCVRILRNLIPAMRGGTRVVVCDNIMPEMASTRYEEKGPR